MSAETGTGRDFVGATAERLRVDDVMRPATSTVEGTAHLSAAAYLMKHRGDTALVITTDDADLRPIVLITDADIAQAVADGRPMEYTRIRDLRLTPPLTVESGTSAWDAAKLMLSRHIHHLPVVGGGRLVGLVEFSDVCRPLFEAEPVPQPVTRRGGRSHGCSRSTRLPTPAGAVIHGRPTRARRGSSQAAFALSCNGPGEPVRPVRRTESPAALPKP